MKETEVWSELLKTIQEDSGPQSLAVSVFYSHYFYGPLLRISKPFADTISLMVKCGHFICFHMMLYTVPIHFI